MKPSSATETGSRSPSARPAQPARLDPPLATLTRERFSDPAWIFERKLDGERCLAFRDGSELRLMTRNQKVVTATYPELVAALKAQHADDFIVDGEVVAFDGNQTSFARLQQRLGVHDPGQPLLTEVPVYYYLFDVLWAAGQDTRPLPLRERKRLLRSLLCFTDPQGSRTGFGALLLGYYDRNGKLAYAGKVGTGFDQRTLTSLHAALAA